MSLIKLILAVMLVLVLVDGGSPASQNFDDESHQPNSVLSHSYRLFAKEEENYAVAHRLFQDLSIEYVVYEGNQQKVKQQTVSPAPAHDAMSRKNSPPTESFSHHDVDKANDEGTARSKQQQQPETRFFGPSLWSQFLKKLGGSGFKPSKETTTISALPITVTVTEKPTLLVTSSVTDWATSFKTATVAALLKCIPITQFSFSVFNHTATFPVTTSCRSGRLNPNAGAAFIRPNHQQLPDDPAASSSNPPADVQQADSETDGPISRVSSNRMEITASPQLSATAAGVNPLFLLESSFLHDDNAVSSREQQQPVNGVVFVTISSTMTTYSFTTMTLTQTHVPASSGGQLTCLPAAYIVC